MPKISYVNGRYVPHAHAHVHIEDRGFQFADSIYDAMDCVRGYLADEVGHMMRLTYSLNALEIPWPMTPAAFGLVLREVVRRNGLYNGSLYIQISRGVAPRDFKIPDPPLKPTLIIVARAYNPAKRAELGEKGKTIITVPDLRWARRDIKTVSLLPASLALHAAHKAGADDAWMVDEQGFITEATSSNAWIVKNNVIYTRPTGTEILSGVTRSAILEILREMGVQVREEAFTPREAEEADEAFVSGSISHIIPVVAINGTIIGDGQHGALTREIARRYRANIAPPQTKQYGWREG